MTKRAINSMLKSGTKGSIVNIASVAGFRGFTSGAAYTASKHGLIVSCQVSWDSFTRLILCQGLTKNTAVFYGPKGIRCNAIAAGGMVSSPIRQRHSTLMSVGFSL